MQTKEAINMLQRQRYAKRKTAGLCWACEQPTKPGVSRCPSCAKTAVENSRKRRRISKEKGQCRDCKEVATRGGRCEAHVEYNRQKSKKCRQDLHKQVLETYGNKCMCCGEPEPHFLDIDHIQNNGQAHRKKLRGHSAMWRDMIKNYDPSQYQVLCSNCNQGKRRNRGICPHKG